MTLKRIEKKSKYLIFGFLALIGGGLFFTSLAKEKKTYSILLDSDTPIMMDKANADFIGSGSSDGSAGGDSGSSDSGSSDSGSGDCGS